MLVSYSTKTKYKVPEGGGGTPIIYWYHARKLRVNVRGIAVRTER